MPNIWLPDGVLPGFKETCLDYFWVSFGKFISRLMQIYVQTCNKAKFNVLSALAVGLHLPEDFFDQYHQKADNQLRLLHYPRHVAL